MKILTKKWVEKQEQVKFIDSLKEFNQQKHTYKDIESKSKSNFNQDIAKDDELLKVCLNTNIADKLYQAKIKKDKNTILSLPKNVYNKISDIKLVILGYANKEDKELLTSYANKTLFALEKDAERANKSTEIAEDYLPEEFILDEIVGELVNKEYSSGKDYFINIGGLEICISDYQIIEREKFKINKWDNDNPLTLWTTLVASELHYIADNSFELHLLFLNGDKYANENYWYFTLKGSNVKYV